MNTYQSFLENEVFGLNIKPVSETEGLYDWHGRNGFCFLCQRATGVAYK